MPTFALNCLDKADAIELRTANRPAHVAHCEANDAIIRMAGPLLNDGGTMIGSLLILDTPDKATAQAFADADPYATSGVFARVELHEIKIVRGGVK